MVLAGLARRRGVRAGLVALTGVVAVAALAVVGAGHGYPVRDVHLRSGSAWLASGQAGQVTLMDGTSAEVAGQVQVAPPGHELQVVQQGATAYSIDRTAGTLRRIDGATFDPSQPNAPIPGAHAGLTAFAGPDTVYALDTQRGLFTTADPHTLAPTGPPVSLAARLSADAATLDDAGRLWIMDSGTGDLSWVSGGQRNTQRGVARPGRDLLTLVNGAPVVVDLTGRRAITIQPDTGAVRSTLDLDLRPNDTIRISGSPHAQRLYIVAARGVLDICDLAGGSCDTVVPLNAANDDLGAAVEAGNRLFVPNYTTGEVWVIDLAHPSIVATAKVLSPPGRFQLVNQDGIVFFNDPNTQRAGVIGLSGGVTSVSKYDPGDPTRGLHGATPSSSTRTMASPTTATQVAATTGTPPPTGGAPTTQPPSSGSRPTRPSRPTTRPTTPPPPSSSSSSSSPTDSTPPAPNLTVSMSNTTPMVSENVGLKVNASGSTPTGAHWDFGDGMQADGVSVVHQWAAARTYLVSVQATMPDGRQATTSVSVTVTPLKILAPVQLSPADGTAFPDWPRQTTLTWQPVLGADTYSVVVDCSGCGTVTGWSYLTGGKTTTTSFSFAFPATANKADGRWQVMAVTSDGGTGPPSSWWTFSYEAPPPIR